MGTLIDLTGKKFNRLTVVKRVLPNAKWNSLRWLCKCDCGTEKIVLGGSLKNGNTKSCGCLHNEYVKNRIRSNPELVNMRGIINNYKGNIKKRELKFELTEEQFKKLTQQDCYYCGEKPKNVYKNKYRGEYIYNGLDRLDNTKGYTIDNVVPCCITCNAAKRKLTLQEFKDLVERIYNNMFNKKENSKNVPC